MRLSCIVVLLASLTACQTSDLTLPAPPAKPQPGTVYGRVVYAKAGQSTPIPAAGASITLLGTSLSAISKSDGQFLISGITQSTGTLLFRFDSTGMGMVDHQRAIQLQDIGAGEGRQIALGDVAVTQNARMHGKVALGDKPTASTRLGGTTVFVPAGPFTTYTNDDGSYRLEDLPEGVIHVSFFRSGYEPFDLANVNLRAGEDFSVAEIILTPQATPPPPGNIFGRITFIPMPDNVVNTLVSAVDNAGHAVAGQVSADSSFSIREVPAGLYNVTVAHTGFRTAVIHNILIGSASEVTLPQITLQAGDGTVDCIPDEPCAPTTACRKGKINCSTGTAVCVETGNSVDGSLCGENKYCRAGDCNACTPNAECDPTGAFCHKGLTSCGTGVPVCTDTNTNKDNGVVCGDNKVCSQGQCTSCQDGLACAPTEAPCHTGSISCTSGSPVCVDTQGILENGSSCGTDKVCSGGACISCVAGGLCSPVTAVCHRGTFTCNTGVQICVDDHVNLDNGTTCGMDKVCSAGSCAACTTGASCTPNTNACHAGVTTCASGTSVCVDTNTSAPEGTPCGSGLVCHSSACVPTGFSIVTGDGQSVNVESSAAPVVIQLNDQNGAPIVNAPITVTPPSGGTSVNQPTATTDSHGQYVFSPIMPRDAGTHTWAVASPNQGQILVTVTAKAPPVGVSYPIVNLDRTGSESGVPGAGLLAHVGSPRALVVASDGTIYFTDWDYHRVRRLSPTGQLTNIAGNGSYGFSGDGAAATAAQLYSPYGIALDEVNQQLYVADYYNNAIRNIDLRTGLISTIAGRGSASGPAYGDGGAAVGSALSNPTHVALGPDGKLYVTDSGHNRIRRIDLVGRTISSWATPAASCPSGTPTWLAGCNGYYNGCAVAWDASGNAYISGVFGGNDQGQDCYSSWGVAQVTPDGASFTHVTGYYNGTATEGAPASTSALPGAVFIAFDSVGNMLLSSPDAHVIKRIDATSGSLSTFAGTGTASYSEPFTPAATTKFSAPHAIAFDGDGTMLVADFNNNAIMAVSSVATPTATSTTLVKNGGDAQTVVVNQLAPVFLSVKLADDNGPLAGYPVRWTSLDEGGALSSSIATTDLNGLSSVSVRAGRQAGTYRFRASYAGLAGTPATGSPVSFTLTATKAPLGDIYSLVNVSHTSGNTTAPTPGTVARVGDIYDPITAADGTVYFSDQTNHYVWKLSPSGQLSAIAGNGGCGTSGDGGQATQAQVCYPWGLALDPTTNTLYIADNYTKTVRALNLTTGVISRFAGGGGAGAPDYGDAGPAINASFINLSHLSMGPNRVLYVADYYLARIRKIDLTTGRIDNWLRQPTGTVTTPYVFNSCGSGSYWSGCSMAWDAAGNAYVGGYINVPASSCNLYGVIKIAGDGTTSLVAGSCSGTFTSNSPGPATSFDNAPNVALDSSGNIYVAHGQTHLVQRIDAATGLVTSVAGVRGAAAFAGEETPASAALLNIPSGITFDAEDNLIIADTQNSALRTVAGIGALPPTQATLAKAGGDGQTAVIDQQAATPLKVKLSSTTGALVGYQVKWTSLDAGAYLTATSVTTDQNGFASSTFRVGRKPGTYRVKAQFTDIHGVDVEGSPVSFTVAATDAPAGHIYTAVNVSHTGGNFGGGIPGTIGRVGLVNNVIAASDNTLYFGDSSYHYVWKLSPEGVLSIVAGNGGCGNGGNGGQATAAQICYPWGLALDEANKLLYISDANYDNVRLVNLTTGVITLFAGNGGIGSPSYGDGDIATNAQFSSATHLQIGPDDRLYLTDASMGRIRVMDRTTSQTSTWIQTAACASGKVVLYSCGSGFGCAVRWDAAGNAYVSGDICGTDVGSPTPGVFRINASDQSRELVAGDPNGVTPTTGMQATAAKFPNASAIAVDADGNLYMLSYYSHLLYRVDASNGQLTILAGNGNYGYAGDEVISTSAQLYNPSGLDVGPTGDLFIADYNNYAIRTIAGAAALPAGGAKLALVSGDAQSVYIGQQLPQSPAMAVKLTTTAGAPLVGYTINWKAIDVGGAVLAGTSTTDTNGVANVQARLGLAPGTYRFTASFTDVSGTAVPGSPVTFTQTAVAPDAGDIFTILNVNRTQAAPGGTGQAVTAVGGQTRDIAEAADGTLYYADYTYSVVRAISPEGIVTTVAGIPNAGGNSGNNGPATSAKLQYPTGVALDAENKNLYISDAYYDVVRRVDLVSGNIYAFAGGGTAGAPDYGDDTGTALQAVFNTPTHLAFGPDGNLYVTDQGHNRIRYIDSAEYIHKYLTANTTACQTTALMLASCTNTANDCQITWDAAGNAYVAGMIAGTVPNGGTNGCTQTPGIIQIAAGTGAISHFAGKTGGSTAEGAAATATLFSTSPSMAIDAAGNIYVLDARKNNLRLINGTTGAVTTLAGTGTSGYLGDYVMSTSAVLNSPWFGIIDSNGHYVFSDQSNNAIRKIW